MTELTAGSVVGLLAEPHRLAVFAAAALGARTPAEVAERTGWAGVEGGCPGPPEADRCWPAHRAWRGGRRRVAGPGQGHRWATGQRGSRLRTDPSSERTLRAFLRDGAVTALPAQQGRRRVVLEHLAVLFEPGVRYPERQVNATLDAHSAGPDHVTLRRYLVDAGLLSRAHGEYWRTGGWVDVLGG